MIRDFSVEHLYTKYFVTTWKSPVTGSSLLLHQVIKRSHLPYKTCSKSSCLTLSFCLYEVSSSHSCFLSFNRLLAFSRLKQSDFFGENGNRGGWEFAVRDKGALRKGRGVEVVIGREECIVMLFQITVLHDARRKWVSTQNVLPLWK